MPILGNAFENSSPEHFHRKFDFFKVSEGDDLANASLESSSQQVRIGQTFVHGTQFEEHIIEHGPCEAGPSIFGNFSILHCNIRGFLSHRAELEGHLRLLPEAPALICINETFLDDSVDDGVVSLGGYKLVARRDRHDGRFGGGIICFAADVFSSQIALSEHSVEYERSWLTIHSEIGPVLLGVWYRPPCSGEVGSIKACEDEWRRLSTEYVATILVGDLNVHHSRWLRYSSGVSVEGTALYRFCTANGLKQWVKRPTRDDYLLDLVVSDLPARKVEVLPGISDHNMVRAHFEIGIPESTLVSRTVFDYGKADWASIRRAVSAFD